MLQRHPPDRRVARRYVALCFARFLVTGALASVVVVLGVTGPPGDVAPLFVAGAVTALGSLLLVVASGAALLDRDWAVPALPVLAFAAWTVGVAAALGTAALQGGGAWPMFFLGLLLLLAARPPLMLGNYLAGL
ncbi:hypothetical protein [Streptosporangium sp. NPDC002524]|uniref:hypothetical protein n=1 Tax=Streptosporangium sp. NPDC002524 TaxID=3154537 RepID=UPI00332D091F